MILSRKSIFCNFCFIFIILLFFSPECLSSKSSSAIKIILLKQEAEKLHENGKGELAVIKIRNLIKLADKLYGKNNPESANGYANITMIYNDCGMKEKALVNLNKAVKIYKAIADNDLIDECYWEMIETVSVAISIDKSKQAEIIFKILERNLGKISSYEQNLYFFYRGLWYFNLNQYEQAKKCFQKTIANENLHLIYYVIIYEKLTEACISLGKYREALPYAKKLVKVSMKFYKKGHIDIAYFYFLLGKVQTAHKQYNDAKKSFLSAIDIFKEISPPNIGFNPRLLFSLNLYLSYIAMETNNKHEFIKYWNKVEILKQQHSNLDLRIYNILQAKKDKLKW